MNANVLNQLYALKADKVFMLFFLLSVLLVVSAFVIEYGFGAAPCPMCWQQRYVHWAVGVLALIGFLTPSKNAKKGVLAALILSSLTGLWSAMHQSLGQLGLVELPATCGSGSGLAENAGDLLAALSNPQKIPDCGDWGFTIFGLTLAMWNVFVMTGMAVFLSRWVYLNRKSINEN